MPVRDWKFRIADILEGVHDVLEITRAMDYETFRQDKRTLKAVLYNLAVIGEAARKVPEEVAARYPAIPWREMGDSAMSSFMSISVLTQKSFGKPSKTSFRLLQIGSKLSWLMGR